MSELEYTKLVKEKCKESAYIYLMKKRGVKGQEISYQKLEMADYLLPNNEFTIEEQRTLFEVRNKMSDIPSNFCARESNESKCPCGATENMEHVYYCKYLNKKIPETSFNEVYNGNIFEQRQVLTNFEENIEVRRKFQNKEFPQAIQCDPLSSVLI